MDTLIFFLIFVVWVAMRGRRRWPVLALFLSAVVATLLLFRHHVTDSLPLNF